MIDSGASQHISHAQELFKTYRIVRKDEGIMIADGTKLEASGISKVEILSRNSIITQTDVWHVSAIGANLVSLAPIVDAGFQVVFEKTMCFINKIGVKTMQ